MKTLNEIITSSWFLNEYSFDGTEVENLTNLSIENFDNLFLDLATNREGFVRVFDPSMKFDVDFMDLLSFCCKQLNIDFGSVVFGF